MNRRDFVGMIAAMGVVGVAAGHCEAPPEEIPIMEPEPKDYGKERFFDRLTESVNSRSTRPFGLDLTREIPV